jgi:hypothetical protein
MKTKLVAVAMLGLLALMSGCLVKDTTHTLYLEPDGRVDWTVLETDVHANGDDAAAVAAEEAGFLADVQAGEGGVYRALQSLEPLRADCRILRDERPFTVWNEARFDSLASVSQMILDRFHVPGQATLRTEGREICFELVCYPDAAADDAGEDAKPLEALVEDLDHYRVILTAGQFTEATGFRIEEGGRTAVPVAPDEAAVKAAGGAVRFTLRWDPAAR